jgi:class 3 adenylate cyclase
VNCPACGGVVAATARFCEQCGARLPPEPIARPASGTGGDRRVVTALFADLVDYVRLVAEHDPEVVRRRVGAALAAMSEAIDAFDGTREKFIGDAVFAVFGWPRAHDDDALRATHCALAIRDRLARLEDPELDALQVRIGLATGEVVAAPREVPGDMDWSLTGPAITTAARIQGLAEPGEILLDEPTRRATRKRLAIEDLGERVLRGQRRPVRLGRLLGDTGFQPWQPPSGRFIGRVGERDTLLGLVGRLEADRVGGIAVVAGEAGIGKSRLLADLEVDVRRAGLGWTWVDNVSYGRQEPYRFGRSLAEVIAQDHGMDSGSFARRLLFTSDTNPDDVRRWSGAIAAIARDAAFSGWEAEAELVPTDPVEVVAAIRSLGRAYMEHLLELDGPRVVVIDDLHWIDASSAGIFEELVGVARRRSLLIVVGSRPEGLLHPALEEPDVVRIELRGFDERETRELARAVAGAEVDVDDARRLHARTGGNPLFIGETVRAIVDEGAITDDGRLEMDGAAAADLPVTLRALLGSRIDALLPAGRTVLRVGSVIGMTFHEPMLEEILAEPIDPAVFERLAEAAMIVPTDAIDGWRFCHPLIHDAAYRSLLATDRTILHTRVADRLEALQPDRLVGTIALHRAAAGDSVRAIPLLLRAAEMAAGMAAPTEAADYLETAAGLEPDPDVAAELRRRATEARGMALVG